MKIVKLNIRNFMGVSAIQIVPDGAVVKITGKNGAGKSSVLDAIIAGFAGSRGAPAMPVRRGQKKAKVVIDAGEYTITRRFKDDGDTDLVVKSSNGFKAPSPQALLDKIVGQVAFDPLAFCNLPEKAQRELLLKLVGLDLAAHDEKIDGLRQGRSLALANKKRATDDCARWPYVEGLPAEPPATTEIASRLMEAQAHNAAIAQKQEAVRSVMSSIEQQEATKADLLARVKQINAWLDEAQIRVQTEKAALLRMAPIDVRAIQEELVNADDLRAKIGRNQRYLEAKAVADKIGDQVTDLYHKIEDAEAAKAGAIAAAQMPIAGLGIVDGAVTLDGIPIKQVNHAEEVKVSVAIGMALNPDLRVLLVNANGLGPEVMDAIETAAKDGDYQIWEEVFDESGEVGFVIEDGKLKGQSLVEDEDSAD